MTSRMEKLKILWRRRSVKIAVGAALVLAGTLALWPKGDADLVDAGAHLCHVQRGDLVVSILQSGELQAKVSRDIVNDAYQNAKIVEIVADGAAVTNGQMLFELESSELMERYLDQQSDVANAEADLKTAQENLEIARLKNDTDLESAKLKVELAALDLKKYVEVEFDQMVSKAESDIYLSEEELKKARSELEGTQELFDKGYANKQDLDSYKLAVQRKEIDVRNKTTDLEILKDYTNTKRIKELKNDLANAESALARLRKTIDSDVLSKQAAIESKKTKLEIERNQLATRSAQYANTKVHADFDGQVFYPQDRRGAKIEKGATVNFRQKILSYPDLSAWNLKVGIPEAMIDKISIGQEAVATLEAIPGTTLRGRVEKISAVPDSQDWFSSGVKTYTIMVDVQSGAGGQLKPGMSATVEIVTDQLRNVLHIPIQAVVSSKDKHYVYVVKHGRRALREVEIGKYNTQSIEILKGVEENEELLLYAEVELEADSKLKKSPLNAKSATPEAKEAKE